MKTIAEVQAEQKAFYGTANNTFDMLPVGSRVKIICLFCDFQFFFGETGEVIQCCDRYLGIRVKFDQPRHFEDGYIQTIFNFNPSDLFLLDSQVKKLCPYCNQDLGGSPRANNPFKEDEK